MKKVMKRIVALALVLTMALSTVIVSSAASKKAGKVTINATGVSVKSKTITLAKKKNVTLGVAAKKVKVKATKKGIVKVSASKTKKTIKVTAKKTGKTTLKISKKGYKTVKVTVKVVAAKKCKAITAKAAAKEVAVGSSVAVTTKNAKTIKVAKVNKSAISASIKSKKVNVKGLEVGATSFYVYDKKNAANYKKVSLTVVPAEVKATENGDKATYAFDTKTTGIQVSNGKTTYVLDGDDFATVAKAVQDGKVAEKVAEMTKEAGKKVTLGSMVVDGVETVIEAEVVGPNTVKYNGKPYTITVAGNSATINSKGISWTYDKTAGYTVTVDKKAGYTVSLVGTTK